MKNGVYQSALDLLFNSGDTISFTTSGAKIPVTLTGEAANDSSDEEDEDEDEELDESMEDEESGVVLPESASRKSSGKKQKKGVSLATLETTIASEEESEDECYNPMDDPEFTNDSNGLSLQESILDDDEMEGDSDSDVDLEEEDGDSELGEEEEDFDSEDDFEMEEEEEEISPEPQAKKVKLMNGEAKPAKVDAGTPKHSKVEKLKAGKEDKKTPKKDKSPGKGKNTPAKISAVPVKIETPSTKEGKKKNKEGKTPKKDKSDKSQTKGVSTPLSNKENQENKTPKKDKKKNKNKDKDTPAKKEKDAAVKTPKSQMKAGGVLVEDLSVGNGAEVKNGSMVSMYYDGRLKSNGKCFDKNLSGPPFKFRLGRGEVIKGWDVGVQGMKIGGKRRITVPAQMGYGKQGAPPAIPANAALEFDVTMVAFK